MANLKSKQLSSLLTFTTASIDVVSGSFKNLDVASTGQVSITNLFVSDISRFTGSIVLKEQSTTPTAREGGLMYSGSNFYLGFD